MSASNRPILAAAPSRDAGAAPSKNPDQPPPSNPGPKPKRTLIESACAACRKRKSKCDGQRPICSRCQALRTNCVYEAQQGESRWSALRRRHKDVENDRDDLRELLSFLQMRPESEALHIFNRIRTGGFEDLLRLIRHAREDGHAISSQQLSSAPNAMDAGRLPSIQSMLSEPSHVDMQHHAEAGPSSTRQQRLPSFSSDGSGESYASSSLSSPSARP